jgi:hypothetical protein
VETPKEPDDRREAKQRREARRRLARVWTPPKLDPPKRESFNRTGLDFDAEARSMPRTIQGTIIDCHTHLLSAGHAGEWFAAADAFGIDHTITMTPLEEAIRLQQSPFGRRTTLIAVPAWEPGGYDESTFWPRVSGFHHLGSRVVKFHLAPQTMQKSGLFLGSDRLKRYVDRARDLGMIIMTHIGDPQTWYEHPDRYGDDPEFWGTRDEHYDAWEELLEHTRGWPWWGAHLGGWPENPDRLRHLLSTYPDLMLDLSAAKWMVREVSRRRDEMRQFVIDFQDRLMWGSDQVSQSLRDREFYASRWWAHRKLWESDYDGPSPISDPDAPDGEPVLRGLELPRKVLVKLYRENVLRLLSRVGVVPDV